MSNTSEEPVSAPTTGEIRVHARALSRDKTAHSILEDVLGILTGTFAASLGLYFLHACEAVTGGTAGLALLLSYATAVGYPVWFLALNIPFAILAVLRRGWVFTIRTIVSIVMVGGWSILHPLLIPLQSIQPVYGVLAGNVLAGIGMLILFRHRASLGGVSVLALIIQDRFGIRVGWSQMVFDVTIVLCALWVAPLPIVLLSALGAVLFNLILAMNHRPDRYIGH